MVQDEVVLTERMSQDLRRAMVDNQVRTFDVTDQRVLEAFYQVPREKFLPAHLAPLAYSDAPITLKGSGPVAAGRVLLPPLFLARMIQGGSVAAGTRVLVVGSATGYAAALLARLAGSVVALDSDAGFSQAASAALGASGVEVVTGPLAKGHAAGAPYDLILVCGAIECNLEGLFAQLGPKGCLLAIDARSNNGSRRAGKAVRYDMVGGEVSGRPLFDATVPVLDEFRQPSRFVF